MSDDLQKLAGDPEVQAELAKRRPIRQEHPVPGQPSAPRPHHYNNRCSCLKCLAYRKARSTARINKMKAIAAKLDEKLAPPPPHPTLPRPTRVQIKHAAAMLQAVGKDTPIPKPKSYTAVREGRLCQFDPTHPLVSP